MPHPPSPGTPGEGSGIGDCPRAGRGEGASSVENRSSPPACARITSLHSLCPVHGSPLRPPGHRLPPVDRLLPRQPLARRRTSEARVAANDQPRRRRLPPGYRVEAVATGLTFPTGVRFDEQDRAARRRGRLLPTARSSTTPRLLRDRAGRPRDRVAQRRQRPVDRRRVPRRALLRRRGRRARRRPDPPHLAGRQASTRARRRTCRASATTTPTARPSGRTARSTSAGTATNSRRRRPRQRRSSAGSSGNPTSTTSPRQDVKLAGQNFVTRQPARAGRRRRRRTTGAFVPFGTPTSRARSSRARSPCTRRRHPTSPGRRRRGRELVAWGLRNPFGLAFAPDGTLYVTDNSYDVRGSRPVCGTGDLLWEVDARALGTAGPTSTAASR